METKRTRIKRREVNWFRWNLRALALSSVLVTLTLILIAYRESPRDASPPLSLVCGIGMLGLAFAVVLLTYPDLYSSPPSEQERRAIRAATLAVKDARR